MYYSIENSTGKDVGNVFPQASCLNQQLAHSIQLGNFVNIDGDLLYSLEPKAKLTNILSQAEISAQGFLIDEKTRETLKKFEIIAHNYNRAIVKDNNRSMHQYFWLHLATQLGDLKWLDYGNSTFVVREYGFKKEDVIIKSYQDYNQKSIEVGDMAVINIEKIKIKPTHQLDVDMFIIPFLTRTVFISERLKIAFQENNITGISIKEAFH